MQIPEAYSLILDRAIHLDLCCKDRVASFSFGKWLVKINGKRKEVEGIRPFHAMVLWNGLPAAILSPFGGELIAHPNCNEDMFIREIKESFNQ